VQQILIDNIRVNTFLDSVGRNSKNSKRTYGTGLSHFAEFLRLKEQTIDSIILLLTKGNAGIYLSNNFISKIDSVRGDVRRSTFVMRAVESRLAEMNTRIEKELSSIRICWT
jgi:hypothetical protein